MNTASKSLGVNRHALVAAVAFASLNAAALVLQPPGDDEFDPNVLHVASVDAHGVVAIDPITGKAEPQVVTGLVAPSGVMFGVDGLLHVTDGITNRVHIFDGDGIVLDQLGVGAGILGPSGLEIGPGGEIFVTSSTGSSVIHLDTDGALVDEIVGGDGNGPLLLAPSDIAFSHGGSAFVSSLLSNEIFEYDPSGAFLRTFGSDGPLDGPSGLAFGREGRLFVASSGNDRIVVYDADGVFLAQFQSPEIDHPTDVALGPDALLYVASFDNDRIVVLDASSGLVERVLPLAAGNGGPQSIAFSPFTLGSKIKGSLQESKGEDDSFKDSARFTIVPGSGRMTLAVDDPSSPILATYGASIFVFHGLTAFEADAKKRRVHGIELGGAAGFASLLLDATGKVDKSGIYLLKKGNGDLILAGPDGLLSASVKTTK